MASLKQWLIGVLHRLIDFMGARDATTVSAGIVSSAGEPHPDPEEFSPLSRELHGLKTDIARELTQLAAQMQADLRYNRDFLGEDALTQGLKGESPIDRYASQLDDVRRRLLDTYGATVPAYSPRAAAEIGEFQTDSAGLRIDVNWFVIMSTAVGLDGAAGGVLTRDRRVALAGNLLFFVWRDSSVAMGDIVRSYYEPISRSEFCVPGPGRIDNVTLFGKESEDLSALLKDLAKIAERLSTTKGKPAPPPKNDDFAPAGHTILMDLLTGYRVMDKRSLTQLSQPFLPGMVGVAALSVVVMGVLLVPDAIVGWIAPLVPPAVREILPRILGAAGFAAFLAAIGRTVRLAWRRARLMSLRAAIRTLIRTGTVAYAHASNFFVRFGEPIGKRFLPPRS